MAGDEPALPALDYEHPGPDATAAALAPELDPFAATGSPVLPLGLCLGAQLDWQEQTFPPRSPRATDILLLPQYWAWRLCGVKATEVTSLGAHTHLWRPAEGRFSDLGTAARLGRALFPPLRHAWDPLGPVRPEVAAATGLPADCRVLAGIHDSNASYLPHLVARPPPFTVLSTGTWIIAMAPGRPLDRLDAHADMLANVDARGEPVPTARFMGGREVELVAGCRGAAHAGDGPADVAAIVGRRGDGAAELRRRQRPVHRPSRADRGRSRARSRPAARRWPRSTRRSPSTSCWTSSGAAGPVLVEGSFHRNAAFCGLLAALRPGQPLYATDDPSGTARGAWLLARWQNLAGGPRRICRPRSNPGGWRGWHAIAAAGLLASRDDCE